MDRAGKIYRYMLFSILFLSLLLIGFLGYRIKKMIPDQILLRKGQTEELNIGIPVSAAVQTTGTDRSKENARITTPVVSAFHMTSDTGTSYETVSYTHLTLPTIA